MHVRYSFNEKHSVHHICLLYELYASKLVKPCQLWLICRLHNHNLLVGMGSTQVKSASTDVLEVLNDKIPRGVGFVKCFQQSSTSVTALLPTALLPRQGKGITQKTVYKTYSMRHFVT